PGPEDLSAGAADQRNYTRCTIVIGCGGHYPFWVSRQVKAVGAPNPCLESPFLRSRAVAGRSSPGRNNRLGTKPVPVPTDQPEVGRVRVPARNQGGSGGQVEGFVEHEGAWTVPVPRKHPDQAD